MKAIAARSTRRPAPAPAPTPALAPVERPEVSSLGAVLGTPTAGWLDGAARIVLVDVVTTGGPTGTVPEEKLLVDLVWLGGGLPSVLVVGTSPEDGLLVEAGALDSLGDGLSVGVDGGGVSDDGGGGLEEACVVVEGVCFLLDVILVLVGDELGGVVEVVRGGGGGGSLLVLELELEGNSVDFATM